MPAPVYTQTGNDSLLSRMAQIRKMPLDTAQINMLRKLGSAITESDSSLSKQLLHEALAKSLKVGETNTITDCYRILGVWHSSFDLKDSALLYYRLSLQSARSNGNLYLVAGAQFNIGNIYYWKGMYDSCIHYYQAAAQVFEDPEILKDKSISERQIDRRKSDLYGNMSSVFNSLKNLSKADEHIDKAIAISKKYDSPAAADALAFYMQSKADNYRANGFPEKALRTRLQFLPQMREGQNAKIYLQQSYQNISQEYFALGITDSAQLFAEKSLQLATNIQVPAAIAIAIANLQPGRIAMDRKEYKLATGYLSKSRDYFENASDPLEQQSYYDVMRQLSFQTGNYKEAYEYFEKYKSVNDSLLLSEKTKEFAEREMRYETEKKENQIQLQHSQIKQKNILNYLLIGSSVALAIILLLTYRNYKNRQQLHQQQIHELETEKQLSSTQYLLKLQEDKRSRLAKDLHDGLGGLLSGVKLQLGAMKGNLILSAENAIAFDRALNKLDESIGEMRRVAHNMMPEALIKLGLRQAVQDYCDGLLHNQSFLINFEMHGLEERMDSSVEIVLYRIVQELLNNAVKHSNASSILVQMMGQNDGQITITVEDNGKGFDLDKIDPMRSAGIRNIESRVNYLNGAMNIKSSSGKGTSVYIECKAKFL
ncbi:histidine kinase/DNA gyrase B/HSP90-like ATPase [Pseudobacter ginsenosidimutans]|uniref:Histidine kinase/DNA gyrase B/HSP90-like ATPase n=2 Tax=Pseudobacter ginsenosidimutans TaxID=661488 RepID=A0A4Q7MU65_9BACT|nr:histidine kinase/DNA gyrase B/HSP90-like ATPase [Pseudobacter ginsenosidimutans]